MTKKLIITFSVFTLIFASCGRTTSRKSANEQSETTTLSTSLDGVVINGVRWATRNVDAPDTFAQNPEDAGMFFQWNRSRSWSASIPGAGVAVSGWDSSVPTGTTWERENDPCPEGWRVPTRIELQSLVDAGSIWVENWNNTGSNGRLFGTAPNQIFLPAAGWRYDSPIRPIGALSRVGAWGFYWSSTPDFTTNAWQLGFYSGRVHVHWLWRSYGLSVRCVAE